ncbi:MAG: NUDIX domain-containing protein [Bacteriovoracaceae bacterium]
MNLLPVSLAIFMKQSPSQALEVWVQRREDDGIYHGLLEFPGGKVEANETPLDAAVREVAEEVGISIAHQDGKFMGVYPQEVPGRTILLYVFLFPDYKELADKGQWLKIEQESLSSVFKGIIPSPNHQIIDDLYRSLYDVGHE